MPTHTVSLFVEVECEVLLDPLNGMVMLMGTSSGSMAMYTCVMGFMLEGDMTRTCQLDGEWSGEEPVCICELALIYSSSLLVIGLLYRSALHIASIKALAIVYTQYV